MSPSPLEIEILGFDFSDCREMLWKVKRTVVNLQEENQKAKPVWLIEQILILLEYLE